MAEGRPKGEAEGKGKAGPLEAGSIVHDLLYMDHAVHQPLDIDFDFPQRSLSDFINKRVEGMRDVVVDTDIPSLGFAVGAQDLLNAANPKEPQKWKLIRHINSLDIDYIILDLGAPSMYWTSSSYPRTKYWWLPRSQPA